MTAEIVRPRPAAPTKATRKRILTGDRPTGPLHVGNYVGTLANRVKLQDEYETFLLVADHHMLTTRLEDLGEIAQNIRDDVIDNLAVGVDPEKVTYLLQSLVPQIPELHLYFSMLVSVPRVERIPTLKDQLRDHGLKEPTYGLLGYPILQAADILVVKGDMVPVGRDQESHIELTREIARRFNQLFAPVFPEPKSLIPDVGLLPGTDGREKMGKSLGNAIYFADDEKAVAKKVKSMYTDPKRIRATDPGTVEGNPVFTYLDSFASDKAEVLDLKRRYREGTVSDVEVKSRLLAVLEEFLAPIRERRAELAAKPRLVDEILAAGSERARREASETLREVRHAMKLDYFGR
ncbi:MAG TPA: tryptophan--tRNA ligase [Candidatus Limnocylindrales bacterium]|nr:tryptophan--tRNA ligase [Candidatus Limnocylindrales bacterium]